MYNKPNYKKGDINTITAKEVSAYIEHFKSNYLPSYKMLCNYYVGNQAILNRELDESKPNNKLVNNYAQTIVDTKVGYLYGNPISITTDDEEYSDILYKVFKYNSQNDKNLELGKMCSIYGNAFELLYIDEFNNICFTSIAPTEMFGIYDTTIANKLIGAVRFYSLNINKEVVLFAEVYTSNEIIYYNSNGNKDGELNEVGRVANYFTHLPIIEYVNNKEKLGDFETVKSLIDAYNLVTSDSVNEVNYFADAYLVLKNVVLGDENITDVKNNRIIELDMEGSAEYLTKQINDGHIQNVLDRLNSDIHKFSKTPDMSDENFLGNVSGEAMKYKLHLMELDSNNKEAKFTLSLYKRFNLITDMIFIKTNKLFDVNTIKIQFTRNMPTNTTEQIDSVVKLNGTVSLKTRLSMLPFIDDVDEEIELLNEEQLANSISYDNFVEDEEDGNI